MSGLSWWQEKMMATAVPGGFTIAFDVDSVLFPINEIAILPALRHHLGLVVEQEDITDFDYRACLGPKAKEVAFEQFKRKDLYDRWTITLEWRAVLDRLREHNRVLAVSSPFAEHASSKWAFCERAGFSHDEIVLCGDKTLVVFDAIVDDRPDTVLALPGRAVVFDQPWNRMVRGVPRANGWEEIIPCLREVLR